MPTLQAACDFLIERASDLFGRPDRMLYVGHRSDTNPWWRTTFAEALGNPELHVLDIQKQNLDTAAGFATKLYLGDIRTAGPGGFGLVFWDEGPEHVTRDEALACLVNLMAGNGHVLISCPWGYQPQGSGPNDPEFHHWGPQPQDFASIGMSAMTFGIEFDGRRNGHGNLIAWA